jgi:23S rRNA-/tRNA-specific pseudouridylate synthase
MSVLAPRKCGDENSEQRDPPLAHDYEISVLYRDEKIMVVDKPYDIRVDGAFPVTVEKLVEKSIEMDKFRLCNQLDYATSGVLVLGLSKSGARECNKLFSGRRTSKWYLAVGVGSLKKEDQIGKEMRVTAKIFEPENDFRMIIDQDKGLEAESILIPVQTGLRFPLPDRGSVEGTLFVVRIITGRRHQIRLHMRFAGYPILGDATYGERPEGLARMMLHAWKLVLPFGKDRVVRVTAPVPEEILHACKNNDLEIFLDRFS